MRVSPTGSICLLTSTLALVLALPTGCTDIDDATPQLDGAVFSDGSEHLCSNPKADEDGDGISNGDEGCVAGRDSDGDKVPDWQDFDSDDDGILDALEKGDKTAGGKCAGAKPPKDSWPCDTDGDGVPDYLDVDSDGEGRLDRDEDPNGDGLVGCCLSTCNKPGSAAQAKCALNADGCGSGQACVAGACTPALAYSCSDGETSPTDKDTFGTGHLDSEGGFYICREATEDRPQGRKPVQLRKSEATAGDWHLALETSAKYAELTLSGAGAKQAAAVIDQDGTQAEVAGFVISRDTTEAEVQTELAAIIKALQAKPPGGGGTVSQRSSGTQVRSHDKFDSVQGTILDVSLSSPSNVSTVRNEIIGALLSKSPGQLGNLPGPYGSSHSDFVVRFVTLKRVAFARDSKGELVKDKQGNPTDSGDKSRWRLIVMGAVAAKTNYQDVKRQTGFIVNDLSDGTSLATAGDVVTDECDVGTITALPVADIIWVVDESGSMDDDRQNIVNNANNFFSRALSSGLDFRMCVTNVVQPNGSYKAALGKCCSTISTVSTHDGGVDRFLLPSEQGIFSACIKNPPGYEGYAEYGLVNAKEAVTRHLPRVASDPKMIRPDAKLVVIVATDEYPESLASVIGSANKSVATLPAATQAAVDAALQPYLSLFTGASDPEAAAMFHVIGGVSNNSCSAFVAHGYKELAQQLGGQVGDVCQKDLGNTLQVVIDSVVGSASPVRLEFVPISASLAVALDGVTIKRGRDNGFDYRSANNALVFVNVKYKKGSGVVASYKRWVKQSDPDFAP